MTMTDAPTPPAPTRSSGSLDGKLTVAAILASGRRRWGRIVQLVCAALVTLIAVVDTVNISRVANDVPVEVNVGGGLILVLVAGIAWTLVSLLLVFRRP